MEFGLTKEERLHLRTLAEKATSGPWVAIRSVFGEPYPDTQFGYVIGFPAGGAWKLRFNSDRKGYYGSGTKSGPRPARQAGPLNALHSATSCFMRCRAR